MKINQTFVVAQPVAVVWEFFHDIPKVAECLPGAEFLGVKEDGSLGGKVSAKVGPFQASFEGEAKVTYDEASKKVDFEGKGVDRKGASRGKMTMVCQVSTEGLSTKVDIDANVQLSGSIAQFGRTGLLTEIAGHLVADFVKNAEAELAAKVSAQAAPSSRPSEEVEARATTAGRPLSATTLMVAVIKDWLRSLFRKTA